MTETGRKNWQAVQEEVRRRIHARIWAPGEMIPNEQDLAEEFGCARATVNRALRNLSEAGLLERRRKAGTRVALHPVRKATLSIPLLRKEIADRGAEYGYRRLDFRPGRPPADLAGKMNGREGDGFVRVMALHLANRTPFALEDRWINLATVPEAAGEDFTETSANEWLVENAPYTHGDIAFSAVSADAEKAGHLDCLPGAAIFTIERMTWNKARAITHVQQFFRPGYRMKTQL